MTRSLSGTQMLWYTVHLNPRLQDGVTVGLECTLQPATLHPGGRLVINPLVLEAGCFLGNCCHVEGGCHVPAHSTCPPLTVFTTFSQRQQMYTKKHS